MEMLILCNNKKGEKEVTKKYTPIENIITIGNALEINKYLMEHEIEVINSEYLKKELKRLREDMELEKSLEEALKEDDVIKLRDYIEDELLN